MNPEFETEEFESIKELEKEIEKNLSIKEPVDSSTDSAGFTVSKIEHGSSFILVVTFLKNITDADFSKFLAILDKLLDMKKKFALLVDTRQTKGVPVKTGLRLISWMKKRKPDIPGILLGSSIVINSKVIIGLVNSAFKIQKPTSPNLLTSDFEKSKNFLFSNIK